MKISTVRMDLIYYCWKRSDRIVIRFDAQIASDGTELVPAGELECKAVTEYEEQQYVRDYGELASDMLMSNTVTRFGTLFWDEGEYRTILDVPTSG